MYKQNKIKTWAVSDQPKEKLTTKGTDVLSDAELLSILIAWGTTELNELDISRTLLSSVNNDWSELSRLTLHDLCKIEGITKPKALKIIAALEIGRRKAQQDPINKGKISSSRDAFTIFAPMLSDISHEEFWVLYLNRGNKIIETYKVSQGGLSGTVIDTRLILKRGIELLASGIILCHNHPSGVSRPSEADKQITEKIKQAAKLMDIDVLDHVIIAGTQYCSFADDGIF